MELFNAQHVLHGEPVTGELPSTNSLFKTTINMAWPSMVESFLVALVGFIDTIMVSTLGSYAIAAVGLTQQPKFIGLTLFMSMSTAISALVARRRGEQNRESAVRILKTCILVAVILTAIISVTFTAFADPIIRFAGSADTVTLCDIAQAVGAAFVSASWRSGDVDKPCLVASGMGALMDEVYTGLDALCKERLQSVTVAALEARLFDGKPLAGPCGRAKKEKAAAAHGGAK